MSSLFKSREWTLTLAYIIYNIYPPAQPAGEVTNISLYLHITIINITIINITIINITIINITIINITIINITIINISIIKPNIIMQILLI